MKVFNRVIGVYLIKVFKTEKYRAEFINGQLYLNEAGVFHKLEDCYRGDKYDSKIILTKPNIFIDEIEYTPSIVEQGFTGDEKVPILCATILNENSLYVNSHSELLIRQAVIDEMRKFGDYGLLFHYHELKDNLELYAKSNNIFIDQDIVKYCDIKSNDYKYLYRKNIFNKYFIKDICYKNQSELRFIFLSKGTTKFIPLVPEGQNHIEIKIKPLNNYVTFNMGGEFIANLRIPKIM